MAVRQSNRKVDQDNTTKTVTITRLTLAPPNLFILIYRVLVGQFQQDSPQDLFASVHFPPSGLGTHSPASYMGDTDSSLGLCVCRANSLPRWASAQPSRLPDLQNIPPLLTPVSVRPLSFPQVRADHLGLFPAGVLSDQASSFDASAFSVPIPPRLCISSVNKYSLSFSCL